MSGFFYFASCFKYILTKNISEEDMVKFFTSQVFFFWHFPLPKIIPKLYEALCSLFMW